MRKRILFIIPSLEIGGTVSSLNSIYKQFSKEYDISVLPLASTGKASILFGKKIIPTLPHINYYTADFKDLSLRQKALAIAIKIAKRICILLGIDMQNILCKRTMQSVERNNNYDIVVGFQEGVATLVASHSKAKKKIAWIHCNYEYYKVECKDESAMYSKFNNIICVSKFTAESFRNIMPQHSRKVDAIYNIFNQEVIMDKAKQPLDDARFDNSSLTLLSVGRICDVKRFRMIPNIAKGIKETGKEFKWYIIGPVNQEEEFRILNEGIEKYGLQEQVIWLGYKSNPYPYIAAADLYVCLSLSEACPMVFNEAKMLMTPIISTDFGSAYEFIENGETGYICNIDNIEKQIKEYVENDELRKNLTNKLKAYQNPNQRILLMMNELFS